MKGDISRSTFKSSLHYSSVRMQQGRVLLDAEANEQADIQTHLRETAARDIIGRTGAPRDDAGFRIGFVANDLLISAGRFYVDGILAESEGASVAVKAFTGSPITTLALRSPAPDFVKGAWVDLAGVDANGAPLNEFAQIAGIGGGDTLTFAPLARFSAVFFVRATTRYTTQPDFPSPPFVTNGLIDAADYLVYLDVWHRHITPFEDPLIRETALGGPDTTTRAKTVWQVRLEKPIAPCKTFHVAASTGQMAAQAIPPQTASNPCEIPRSAGYRRLENQLYRVEIHQGGKKKKDAKFKWSRDNGSIVFAVDSFVTADPKKLRLKTQALDDRLSLHAQEWVELIDDVRELHGRPGEILRVDGPPQAADPIVTMNKAVDTLGIDFARNPRLRVWSRRDAAEPPLGLDEGANADGFVELEDGVQIQFAEGTYQTGDYWLIPARTAISQETGSIEWPAAAGKPLFLSPAGIVHHFAPLAELRGGKVEDCRPIFSPITAPDLFYDGGDGQEVMPNVNPNTLVPLPLEIRAGVANGRAIAGATVEFTVTAAQGGRLTAGALTGTAISVKTNEEGIAKCKWEVNSKEQTQTVRARLLDSGVPGFVPGVPSIVYNAHLSTAANVFYKPGACTFLEKVTTVQEALDELCKRPSGGACSIVLAPTDDVHERMKEIQKETNIEICFQAGRFELRRPLLLEGKNSVKMSGAGDGTYITAPSARVIEFLACKSVIVRDLFIEGRSGNEVPGPAGPKFPVGALFFDDCDQVTVEHVRLVCAGDAVTSHSGLSAQSGGDITIHDCNITAGQDQVGIYLDGTTRAIIEKSRVGGAPPSPPAVAWLMKTKLVSKIAVDTPPAQGQTVAKIGAHAITFTLHQRATYEAALLEAISEMNHAGAIDADGTLRVLDDTFLRLATEAGFLGQWTVLKELFGRHGVIAGRASVAIDAHSAAGTILVSENTVRAAAIALRTGGERAPGAAGKPDHYDRVTVTGNDLMTLGLPDDSTRIFGVFVGSTSDSVYILGNLVGGNNRKIGTGIHAEGAVGRFAVIRDNHVVNYANGIIAKPNAMGEPKQWRVSSNFVIESSNRYDAPDFDLEWNK